MSKLDELIAEMCPNGVELLPIGELVYYEQPSNYIVESTNYDDEYETPVLTAGQSFILGYTNETEGIYQASKDNPVIIFDDFTGAFKWVDFPFKVKSSAMKILSPDEDYALLRYVFHLMGWLGFTSTEHKRLWISIYSEFRVPVPPLEVQREIVRILDSFTDLIAELSMELTARKNQYMYYLDRFYEDQTACLVPLRDVGKLVRGKRFVHADAVEMGVPCIHYGELYTYYGTHADSVKSHIREELRPKMRYANKGDVVIVGAGENNIDIGVGVSWEGEESVAVHDACYTLTHNQNSRYISYYLRSHMYHEQIKKYVSSGKICAISAEGIGSALIPIPSLEKQEEIVSVLDKFEALCNGHNEGIPTEIELRKRQYEYYRESVFQSLGGRAL